MFLSLFILFSLLLLFFFFFLLRNLREMGTFFQIFRVTFWLSAHQGLSEKGVCSKKKGVKTILKSCFSCKYIHDPLILD